VRIVDLSERNAVADVLRLVDQHNHTDASGPDADHHSAADGGIMRAGR
jgi:hypothetical protein